MIRHTTTNIYSNISFINRCHCLNTQLLFYVLSGEKIFAWGVIFEATVPCNMKRTHKLLLWIIPQWHIVFIYILKTSWRFPAFQADDIMKVERITHDTSFVLNGLYCIYKVLYWMGCIVWYKFCFLIEYILNIDKYILFYCQVTR